MRKSSEASSPSRRAAASVENPGVQATNAPFTITSGANSVTVGVNQRVSADDFYDGRWWETLAAIKANGTKLTVTLTDAANGTVVADAVRVDVPTTSKSTPAIEFPATNPLYGTALSGMGIVATYSATQVPGGFDYFDAGTQLPGSTN